MKYHVHEVKRLETNLPLASEEAMKGYIANFHNRGVLELRGLLEEVRLLRSGRECGGALFRAEHSRVDGKVFWMRLSSFEVKPSSLRCSHFFA